MLRIESFNGAVVCKGALNVDVHIESSNNAVVCDGVLNAALHINHVTKLVEIRHWRINIKYTSNKERVILTSQAS